MPELPEVEVVKRSLVNKIQNSIVKAVKINDGRLRYRVDKNKVKKIIGLTIKKISRRSKILLFFFNKKTVMLVHLGMTGKFFFILLELIASLKKSILISSALFSLERILSVS